MSPEPEREEPVGRGGSGWEKRIIPLLIDLFNDKQYPPDFRIVFPPEGGENASEVHNSMAWGADLLWCSRFGTRAEIEAARIPVMAYFERELKTVGLWGHFQLCPNPYGGFFLDGALAIRLAAQELVDTELMAASDHWFVRLGAVCSLNSTPSGEVWVAGKRARPPKAALQKQPKRPPLASHLTGWWREVAGLPQVGSLTRKAKLRHPYWAPIQATRVLKERYGDDFGGAALAGEASLPLLEEPMAFMRGENERGKFFASKFLQKTVTRPELDCGWVVCYPDRLIGLGGCGLLFDVGFEEEFPRLQGIDRVDQSLSHESERIY